jgi:CheY-like chemotaxis protein
MMNNQAEEEDVPRRKYREISSWLETMRKAEEKEEGAEKSSQIILLVDHKPVRQFYTSIFLQRLKYDVMMAKTAEDALTFLGLSIPLAIVAEVDLQQHMAGMELLKHVKQNSRTQDIPFLMYTSNKDPHVERQCREAGAAAYLTNAATLDELYVAIQKATQAKPRRVVRLTTHCAVVIGENVPTDGKIRHDAITALSEKGMFVKTTALLAYGSVHYFTFHLPTAPGWIFRMEGEVIYNHLGNDNKGETGIGVKFLKIGPQDQELIKDFIRKTLMEGISTA